MKEYGLWEQSTPFYGGGDIGWLEIPDGVVFHTSSLGLAKAQLKVYTAIQQNKIVRASIRTFDDPSLAERERADGFPLEDVVL